MKEIIIDFKRGHWGSLYDFAYETYYLNYKFPTFLIVCNFIQENWIEYKKLIGFKHDLLTWLENKI